MKFAQVDMLNWLWALFFLVPFLIWGYKRHQKRMASFIQSDLIKDVAPDFDAKISHKKNVLLILVFVFSVLALARPQWGFEWQEVKRQGLDILVVIDTSKSMLTQDVKPNRLERTKLAVEDLLKRLQGDRIGLVAFAGDAFLMCPFTVDYSGFLLSLNDLNISAVPRGGTNIGRAIEVALKSYGPIKNKHKAVIIITDGDNLEGDPLAWAAKAKEQGVKIYTIGIGTEAGELIQIDDGQGGKTFLKDNQGNFVKSRLNESLSQKVALKTSGVYVRSSGGEFGLDLIYDRELSKFEKRDIESKQEKRYHERFQFPLAVALLFLVLETCWTVRKR